MVAGAARDPRGGRCPRLQQLHAVLPGAAGTDRLRRVPVRPARADPDPAAMEVQPERDVGLDADDRRAPVDHVVLQAGPLAHARAGHRRAVRRAIAPPRTRGRLVSWTRFFLGLDRVLKWLDRRVPAAWRRPAIRAAHRWMMEHCEETDGLGAIFPPMVYAIIALKCLGYDDDSPEVRWAIEQLDDLQIARGRPGPRAALRLARLGHGDRHDRAGRRRAAGRTPGLGPGRGLAAGQGAAGTPATGPSTARASSRPAGTSSSATSSTPTSTTARW